MSSPSQQDSPRPLVGRGPALKAVPDNATAGQMTHLRACAQATALLGSDDTWPTYGTLPWLQLNPQDPRVYVATLEAAELHRMAEERRYDDAREQAIATRQAAADARVARKGAARIRPPHTLTATPGWPPIQIPGRPGEYLTYQGNE
ncbi:DUF2742 domain-containing protein [Streptomyces sp. NPDC005402]|uniref:DUF2742 domain-containing protein n=1 Tax=Streptomyces sp. NPDC005402 TaxID=3155338 RepID=UPI0033ABF2C5